MSDDSVEFFGVMHHISDGAKKGIRSLSGLVNQNLSLEFEVT
jgi:hypothetical protein